ncbi:MAG TPA: type II toxin-antitoxin system VapB family antitoxin [Blastocatellia bacterium]|nr:type II toxin-antitoxin system VapB family antitoxin [Blastocatellia bacterium]
MPDSLDELIELARKLGHHCTKKEAVTAALVEYVNRRRQLEIISLFGKIEYDENYNYKRERNAKRMPSLSARGR